MGNTTNSEKQQLSTKTQGGVKIKIGKTSQNEIETFQGVPDNDKQCGYGEKILSKDGIDRRVRAKPSDYNSIIQPWENIGLLRIKFGNKIFVGTASMIPTTESQYKLNGNCVYLLTCAHNVVDISPIDKKIVYADYIWFEQRRNNSYNNSLIEQYNINNIWVYPKYFNDNSTHSGNDLAIVSCQDKHETLAKMNSLNVMSSANLGFQQVARLAILGFPAEKKGELWGMHADVNVNSEDEVIYYSEIDTSGGQSGSPIFSIRTFEQNSSEDLSEFCSNTLEFCSNTLEFCPKNVFDIKYVNWHKVIIGVHTGGHVQSGKNWGTRITHKKFGWIENITTSKVSNKTMLVADAEWCMRLHGKDPMFRNQSK